ncbi:MAG: restriction endonuclease [Alphaproteobacteria bacterium]|nr:restriction endonuclease [Alphaproteobacteria bacterium]
MLSAVTARGFRIEFRSHAKAILAVDFPQVLIDLETALATTTIPIEEIIAGGGGKAKGTQRLRHALHRLGWPKKTFVIERRINGVPRESQTHEIDHVREFEDRARVALEIEWNNKDPFFDRDLENFKRLHADGAISVGIIITRGPSLHDNMRALVSHFVEERQIRSVEDLETWGYRPTRSQLAALRKRTTRARNTLSFHDAFVSKFVADKFGEATTHWRKLDDRLRRGVGNPCPLLLIGLPDTTVTFNEGQAALREVVAEEDSAAQSSEDGSIA